MGKRYKMFVEILRKVFHLSGLVVLVGYTFLLNYFGARVAILVLTGLLLLLLEIERIRLDHKPRIAEMFSILLRRHERNNITAAVFFVISCVIAFSAFDYSIALLAVLLTVFGDLFAAIMGKSFGKTIIWKKKTFVGTFSGFAANIITGLILLPNHLALTVPMAITASVVELLTHKLEDNLTVPLFSGFVGQMIVYFFALQIPNVGFKMFGII